jgi:hypothetical protein
MILRAERSMSSRSGAKLIFLFEHDLRANALRLSRGKPVSAFPDHALLLKTVKLAYSRTEGILIPNK